MTKNPKINYIHRTKDEVEEIVWRLRLNHGNDRVLDAVWYGGLKELLAEGCGCGKMTVEDALQQAFYNI